MATPQQPNPENTEKKPAAGGIVYGVCLAVLAAVLLISSALYLWEQLPTASSPTEPAVQTQPTPPASSAPTDQTEPTQPTEPPNPPVEEGKTDIRLNEHSQPVSLLGQAARDYLAAENVRDVTAFLTPYWETESRSDRGKPVELSFTVYSLPKGVTVKRAEFRVFAANGSGNDIRLEPAEGGRSVYVYNLQTGREYHYEVKFTLSDGEKLTLPGSFKTAAGPRLLNINGIVNVRDLGGWVTKDGKTVKQGLLFRGSELDGAVEADYKLSQQGLAQMQALGIKTDLDLRHAGSDMIPGAEHIYYDAIQYEHAFTPQGKEAVRRLFEDLADPANYPAYLHCTYGADRTGTMCYLLLGLLGVSDADLKRDYELTALYYGYVSPAQMDVFVEMIAQLPGNSTRERIEYFLLDAGVTREQMESIRQIFLG